MFSQALGELSPRGTLAGLTRLRRVHCFAHVNHLDCVEAAPPAAPGASKGVSFLKVPAPPPGAQLASNYGGWVDAGYGVETEM